MTTVIAEVIAARRELLQLQSLYPLQLQQLGLKSRKCLKIKARNPKPLAITPPLEKRELLQG